MVAPDAPHRLGINGIYLQALASFSASLMALFVKLGTKHGLTWQTFVFSRSLLLLIVSLVIARRRTSGSSDPALDASTLFKLGLVGVLSYATTVTTVLSVMFLSIADATMLWALAPVVGAILSPVLLKEPVSPVMKQVLPLALVGVALIAQPPSIFGGAANALNVTGLIIGLIQAFSNAGSKLAIRSLATQPTDRILFSIGFTSSLAVCLHSMWQPHLKLPPSSGPTWALLTGACLCSLSFQWFNALGLKRIHAASALAVTYTSTLWGLVYDVTVFGQRPKGLSLVGSVCIFVGSYVLIKSEQGKSVAASGTGLGGKDSDAQLDDQYDQEMAPLVEKE